jgi:hypothetical protein
VFEHPVKLPPKVTVGAEGSTNPAGNVISTESVPASTADALPDVAKLTVHLLVAVEAVCAAVNVTLFAIVVEAMKVVLEVTAVVSAEVFSVRFCGEIEGFVTPAIVKFEAALAATAQAPPLSARVTVTVVPAAEALSAQFVKFVPGVTTGMAGTVAKAVRTTVIVSPAASAPEAVGVKFAVHVAIGALSLLCRALANETLAAVV